MRAPGRPSRSRVIPGRPGRDVPPARAIGQGGRSARGRGPPPLPPVRAAPSRPPPTPPRPWRPRRPRPAVAGAAPIVRRSSTRAVGSGGSPSPWSRCSTAAARSPSSAHGAGSSSSAARAAVMRLDEASAHPGFRARTCAAGIPSRSATSSGPHPPQPPCGDERALERRMPSAESRRARRRPCCRRSASPGSPQPAPAPPSAGPHPGREECFARPALAATAARAPGRGPAPSGGPRRARHASLGGGRRGPRSSPPGQGRRRGSRRRRRPRGPATGQRRTRGSRPRRSASPLQSHTGRAAPKDGEGSVASAAAPSSTSSWLDSLAGSNSPVTSQMTRWPTLTAWSRLARSSGRAASCRRRPWCRAPEPPVTLANSSRCRSSMASSSRSISLRRLDVAGGDDRAGLLDDALGDVPDLRIVVRSSAGTADAG